MTEMERTELARIRALALKLVDRLDRLIGTKPVLTEPHDVLNAQLKAAGVVRWSQEDMEMARYLLAKVQSNLPFVKAPTEAVMKKWADSIYMLQHADNYNYEQIKAVVDWATADEFWKANIRSAPTLRKQFETLLAQMHRHKESLI